MIDHTLDAGQSILHLRPRASLEKADFENLAKVVDPHISEKGSLAGLIIETTTFPGWHSFGAMVSHLRFVRDHHRQIGKIALVTDSALGDVAEHLVAHFISAKIRHFPASALDDARSWITGVE